MQTTAGRMSDNLYLRDRHWFDDEVSQTAVG